jgi:hypothetical protein
VPLPDFFVCLGAQLADERGPHGEPSRSGFLSLELPEIMEAFATGWDDLPQQVPGRADYRILIGAGRLVPSYAVEAQLSPSGPIGLVGLHLHLTWPPGPDEDLAG